MLTERQAFKAGFLLKCAKAGLSPKEAHELVLKATDFLENPEKRAFTEMITEPLTAALSSVGHAVGPVASNLGNWGVTGMLGGPAVVGGLGGLLAAQGLDLSDEDIKEIQQRELAEAYRQHARNVKMRTHFYRKA